MTKPTKPPLYQVGQVTYSISSSRSGPHLTEKFIEGVLWLKDHWIYITSTEHTVSIEKKCKEADCTDPCCDAIVIQYIWTTESMVNPDREKAWEKAVKFHEKQLERDKLRLEGKIKIVDGRFHK